MAKPFKNVSAFKDHEVDVAELEVHEGLMGGFCSMYNVTAASDSSAADQYDINAGGSGNMANLVQPLVPRNIKITVTDADNGITATITVTGKDVLGRAITEVFSVVTGTGKVQTGAKIFASISQIAIVTSGQGAGDTLDAGWQNKLGVGVVGKTFTVTKLHKVGTGLEAAAASGVDVNGCAWMTPTTAPDGAVDFDVWFSYCPQLFALPVIG